MRALSVLPYLYLLLRHLLVSVWTHEHLFYALGYNLVLLYFVVQMVPVLAIRSSFSWLLYLFDIIPHSDLILSTFLLSGTIECVSLSAYVSCPTPRISHFCKEF